MDAIIVWIVPYSLPHSIHLTHSYSLLLTPSHPTHPVPYTTPPLPYPLQQVLEKHIAATGSHRASFLLAHLDEAFLNGKIMCVVPTSEKSNPLVTSATMVTVAVPAVSANSTTVSAGK
jgi:hypothetical protein